MKRGYVLSAMSTLDSLKRTKTVLLTTYMRYRTLHYSLSSASAFPSSS
jgi:hypothetical protein